MTESKALLAFLFYLQLRCFSDARWTTEQLTNFKASKQVNMYFVLIYSQVSKHSVHAAFMGTEFTFRFISQLF